jgi:MFS transporter, YNFM family, putative membrane transport protein
MAFDYRRIGVAIAGCSAFLNLYAPQALLPELSREFGASAAQTSTIMTAGTLAIALSAPFAGAVADVFGRKRIITAAMVAASLPGFMIALGPDIATITILRFIQGLLLPPIFTVVLAYVGDEWPPQQVPSIAGIYVTGASLGGVSGRLIPGIIADIAGWRIGMVAVAALTMLAGFLIAATLPREKNFVRSEGLAQSALQMVRHLRNPSLVATYAVGFGVLFNFIATYTYIGFRLAAAPYRFSNSALGFLFVTYMVGVVTAPLAGRGIALFGRRGFMFALIGTWMLGALLLLAPHVPLIIVGLVLCAGCGLLCQAVSTGYVTGSTREGRSSALGLYFTSFYVGGSIGAFVPGLTWESWGWPVVVAEVMAMLAIMALVVALAWQSQRPRD